MVNIDFKQVVLIGPYTHQHPNGWFFLGMQKAFTYKRYKVIWVNSERYELLNNYDLSNSLFITDENHDKYVPLRQDSFYILLNNNNSRYDNYQKLHIGLYGNDLPNYVQQWKDKYYIQYSLENRELYFPWATELVPQEILANQQESVLRYPGDAKHICILGNIKGTGVSKIFADIKKYSRQQFLKFCVINNKTSKNRQKDLINCQIAPIISTQEQIDRNEIDYRLFQIISYGGFPVTNSKLSANLFDENCIYYANTGKNILIGGIDYKKQHFTDLWKWKVMEHVKKYHTFVQRVEVILWMLLRI